MYNSALKKKRAYDTLLKCQSRLVDEGRAPYVPSAVLFDTVWEYITYPHERIFGQNGKWVKKYNSLLTDMPRPRIYPGPRIIHGFGLYSRPCERADGVMGYDSGKTVSLVKFIYTLHHAKNPHSYITIHEYTIMPEISVSPRASYKAAVAATDHQRIKCLRARYLEGIK